MIANVPYQSSWVMLPRTSGGMGEGAISAGLVRMVRRVADRNDPAGLVLSTVEVDALCAGLEMGATLRQRQDALHVLATNNADRTSVPRGASEVLALRTYLAPDSDAELWAELVDAAARAEDTPFHRSAAVDHLHWLLSAAVNPDPEVVHLPARRWFDGSGAA